MHCQEVETDEVPAVIAGVVVLLIETYVIPAIYKQVISDLIEYEYYNIRNAILDAERYYELA